MTAQNAPNLPVAKKEPAPLMRFFANPVVGLVGTLASVIGVLLAVYFYVQGTRFRELVYYVNPAQAIVVKTGEASRLRVLMGDRELKSDVTTAQIAIWNRGTESLKPGDLLAPLVIRTTPSVPILEATIRKKSRDVIGISLDEKHLEEGMVGVFWNILEEGDGGVVQIVYAGSPDTIAISVSGVIEGQHEIRRLQYSGKILSAAEQVHENNWDVFFAWILLTASIVVIGCSLILLRIADERRERYLALACLLLFLPLLAFSIFIFRSRVPGPPFGF